MADTNFPHQAVDTLMAQVHDPVFFDKLASDWNIQPRTTEEQEQLLELAVILRDARDKEQVKTASHGNAFLSGALDSLKGVLTASGYPTLPTSDEQQVKQAAGRAVQNAELQKAATEYAQYLAGLEG